jgi:alanine-glyoxylate transaminase/serine-glyoxylate transaminase/serine-pyruvate transaminase
MSFQNPVFIPGPTNIPDAIRKACDLPTLDHRSPAFARLFRPAVEGVRRVLKMDAGEVIILPSTGTGGWEAAISNTLSPGDTVLAARFGMFSHRWIDMCQRHGLNVIVIETPWGEGAPLAAIEDALRADKAKAIRAVLATHNETATGVKSDIAGLRKAMDAAEHPAMLFVDGVSSIGSMPFEMTDWGVDIAVAGSQKGFMLPAGLAILGVSTKAIAAMATAKLPRTFFDFADMLRTYATGGYPYTPAVGLIAGLCAPCAHRRRGAPCGCGLGHEALCGAARMVFRHGDCGRRSRGVQRYRPGEACGRWLWHGVRRWSGRGRGKGVPHRASGQPDRTDDAVRPCHRRDVHG